MRVLFLDAYFEPEKIAFTHLENDLLEGLVAAGHEIEIICPTPSRGISKEIAIKYRKAYVEELYGGHVRVNRFWAPHEGKNSIIRAIRYLWCNFRTYQMGKKREFDVIFTNSTPPTQGWIACKLAKKTGASFVYSLQDIFPDSLINAGLAKKDGWLWKIGRKLENYIYKNADAIIVISESFKNNIIKKDVPECKITVVSNWIDISKIYPIEKKENMLYSELGLDYDKFIVVYAGNFGASQGADIIIDAAEILKDNNSIQFAIFGGGSEFENIKNRCKTNKLQNVIIKDLLPAERISEVYSLGDVSLITGKPGVGKAGMPSKTWSIMACNTFIVASFDLDSDLAEILKDTGTGVCVEPGSSEKLANAIITCKENRTFLNYYGRVYVKNNASKDMCVQKYLDIIYKTGTHRK